MLAIVQRVKSAHVEVDSKVVTSIDRGLLLLLGIARSDGEKEINYIVDKTLNLRIFPDEKKIMNKSLKDISGELLLVSQFTLYGDTCKGRRPGYSKAAPTHEARRLFDQCYRTFLKRYNRIKLGIFQADMEVYLVNDGPVTLIIDSAKKNSGVV